MFKKFGLPLRRFSAEVLNDVKAKPFDKIPGPRGILGIGNFYNYFKLFGEFGSKILSVALTEIFVGRYSFDELHRCGMDKYEKFGPIVCERMVPGVSVLWLFDPSDIAQVFNEAPGDYPHRRSHFALKKYRDDRPHVYRTGGLLPTQV